ncbi:MAG TPA: carbohydrate ABC transporter permease [Candidatus Limnocylindrales bacterium]
MSDEAVTPDEAAAPTEPSLKPSEAAARALLNHVEFDLIEAADRAAKAREEASAAERAARCQKSPVKTRARIKFRRIGLYAFLISITCVWLMPLLVAVYEALRTNSDVVRNGIFSIPESLTFDNFITAWGSTEPSFPQAYINTMVVTIPAVIVVLIIGSMVAYAISKYSWKANLLVLMLFTAGNLLPQQAIILPMYRLFSTHLLPWLFTDNGGTLLYNQYIGIIVIHVLFQLGFVVFVLSNYMKALGNEIIEAALMDGAGVFRIWAGIVMPLCKPAVAAMATLQFTFIYNDFFWALTLMSTQDKRPITAALNTINGQYYTNYNLLAAAALLAAVPTILVFLALQRYFISGLSLGSTKG